MSKPTIYIAAGHGGNDLGAVSGKYIEKALTLKTALACQNYLRNYECETVMARTTDKSCTVAHKMKEVEQKRPSLVLEIHYNAGVTILVYVNDNPITLEAILFGAASGVMFAAVLLWFSCYNAVMTSDKFLYLFGRIIPALSLIFSMALRFVPRFAAQLKIISNAQKCVGRDISQGNLLTRAKNGLKILSILITWALENAVDTADSMRCRGYGLPGRTAFSNFRLDSRDKASLGLLGGLTALLLVGLALGETTAVYFPAVRIPPVTPLSFVFYAAYAALLSFPLVVNGWEDIKWARLTSKI